MANKLFLGTNIILIYTLRRENDLQKTDTLFELAEERKLEFL